MASAVVNNNDPNLKKFTDCMYFVNGNCKLNDKCRYRHCQQAAAQTKSCFKWPNACRNAKCPYRHPAPPKIPDSKKKTIAEPLMANPTILLPTTVSIPPREGLISFFWDIENVPIPKGQKPFDIVQRIREQLVVNSGLREYSFSCYCNSTTISQENQLSLSHANVRMIHVPDRKPGAVDRQIMLELDRFERAHKPPATIVLISGDIDFVGKLSDLRHQAGFHVVVIHNKPAKQELKATVNAHFPWEIYTQPQQPTNAMNNSGASANEIKQQPARNQNTRNNQRRKDASPNLPSTPPYAARPTTAKKHTHQCPKCTSEFDSIPALRQHQEAKDHLFECPVCDENFVTLDGQIQHQNSKGHHSAEFKCTQCNRSFPKVESLNQHYQSTNHNLVTNGLMPGSIPSPVISGHQNRSRNNPMEDAAMILLQKGIDALANHYPNLWSSNK